MKRSVVIFSFLSCAVFLNAQSIIQKVNDIKLSEDYIWAQYAHPSPDTALVKAIEWLTLDIENIYGLRNDALLVPLIKHINLKGNEITRAFVYIKKTDIRLTNTAVDKKEVAKPIFVPDALTTELMTLKDIYAALKCLENGISKGTVIRYGSPKDVDSTDDKHLVLFSKDDLAPICVLSPVTTGSQRRNLTNGETDSLDNHHGCYAI